uniref:Uncharacterized protein n=1 Tax=Romanomermis culicivorax TaxID=13658 RepID=A0A915JRU1_ROMCU
MQQFRRCLESLDRLPGRLFNYPALEGFCTACGLRPVKALSTTPINSGYPSDLKGSPWSGLGSKTVVVR